MRRFKSFRTMMLVAASAALVGCASLRSYRLENGDPPNKQQAGITYYLPKRYAEVTFERSVVEAPKQTEQAAKDELASARQALTAAGETLDAASARVLRMREGGITNESETLQKLMLAEVDAEIAKAAATGRAKAAEEELAKVQRQWQEWEQAKGKCGFVDRFSVKLKAPVADIEQRFSLRMVHRPTRTDDWHITTTTGGLLSTANGTIKDETAEIIVALARSAASGRSVPEVEKMAFGVKLLNESSPGTTCKLKPLKVSREIDPSSWTEWNRFLEAVNSVQKEASQRTYTIDQSVGLMPYGQKMVLENDVQVPANGESILLPKGRIIQLLSTVGREPKPADGIYYRRELPLAIQIMEKESSPAPSTMEKESSSAPSKPVAFFLLMVPNHSPTEMIPANAGAFVTTTQKFGFDNGILVSVDSNKPSEILRAAAIPWDVANATLESLSKLVRLRVDYAEGNADLTEQQIRLLQQLKEQLEAQRALDAARAGGASDDDSAP